MKGAFIPITRLDQRVSFKLVQSGTEPEDDLGRPRDPRRDFGILHPQPTIADYADCLPPSTMR